MLITKQITLRYFCLLLLVGLNSQASTGRDCSFLIDQLAKYPAIDGSLSDLEFGPPSIEETNLRIWQDSLKAEKLGVLQNFPIGLVIAAPGHRFLRNPNQVRGLIQYIRSGQGGDFQSDPLLLNINTSPNGSVTSVDLWNAHHRLVAYLRAGYNVLGEIPDYNFEILVNGRSHSNEIWPHFLSAAGFPSELFETQIVEPNDYVREGTVSVSGEFSNYELGSRNSIEQLTKNTYDHRQPRIGIYFGTFDPIHEGHVYLMKQALLEFELDEILIVPNLTSIEKPNATKPALRLTMVGERITDEEAMNLYVGNSSVIIDRFSRKPFLERVAQIYGTSKIFQIIGEDRYRNYIAQGKIRPTDPQNFLVFPRDSLSADIPVDESLKDKVQISTSLASVSTSSTKIRNAIQKGTIPPVQELDPRVFKIIIDNGLYHTEPK